MLDIVNHPAIGQNVGARRRPGLVAEKSFICGWRNSIPSNAPPWPSSAFGCRVIAHRLREVAWNACRSRRHPTHPCTGEAAESEAGRRPPSFLFLGTFRRWLSASFNWKKKRQVDLNNSASYKSYESPQEQRSYCYYSITQNYGRLRQRLCRVRKIGNCATDGVHEHFRCTFDTWEPAIAHVLAIRVCRIPGFGGADVSFFRLCTAGTPGTVGRGRV